MKNGSFFFSSFFILCKKSEINLQGIEQNVQIKKEIKKEMKKILVFAIIFTLLFCAIFADDDDDDSWDDDDDDDDFILRKQTEISINVSGIDNDASVDDSFDITNENIGPSINDVCFGPSINDVCFGENWLIPLTILTLLIGAICRLSELYYFPEKM